MPLIETPSTVIQGGNFFNVEGSEDALGILNPHIAPNAFFNAAHQEEPARCHPGTRERILANLTSHLQSITSNAFVWIHGPAGVGKTAVMRTLCERLEAKGQLLGSFFFFKSDPTRNSGHPFVPTLAYLLCREIEELRVPILAAIRSNPAVLKLSLEAQAKTLLIDPIRKLADSPGGFPPRPPMALVVDGLDECGTEHDRDQVIHVLDLLTDVFPSPLLVFVASRPHFGIRTHFESPPLEEFTTQEPIYQSSQADEDIRKYLIDKFDEILRKHRFRKSLPLVDGRWPSLAIIEILVEKASGQFIVPATVVRFIWPDRANPEHRLQVLLEHLEKDSRNRGSSNLKPFQPLDNLYHAIFGTIDPSCLQDVLDILSICIVYPFPVYTYLVAPISPAMISLIPDGGLLEKSMPYPVILETLGLLLSDRRTYCHELIVDLEALVEIVPSSDLAGYHILSSFHKSLADFLTSVERAGPALVIYPERTWEALCLAAYRHNFWHTDRHALAMMLQLPLKPADAFADERDYHEWLNRRLETSRFSECLNTPQARCYDYAKAAARLPGPEGEDTANPLVEWLSCVIWFVDSLQAFYIPALKKMYTSHRRSLEKYLLSTLAVYADSPELWAILHLTVAEPGGVGIRYRYPPPVVPGHSIVCGGFDVPAASLDPVDAESDNYTRIEWEKGFRLTKFGPRHVILDLQWRAPARPQDRPVYGRVGRTIRELAFKDRHGLRSWESVIEDFVKKAVGRGKVSKDVTGVVLSKNSFLYAAWLDSSSRLEEVLEVYRIPRSLAENLRKFKSVFPNHLQDQEDCLLVQKLIEAALDSPNDNTADAAAVSSIESSGAGPGPTPSTSKLSEAPVAMNHVSQVKSKKKPKNKKKRVPGHS